MGVLGGKSTLKHEPQGLLLLGFFAEAVKWPAALLSSAAGLSRRKSSYCSLSHQRSSYCRSSHRKSGPLWVKLSRVKLLRLKPLSVELSKVQRQWKERLLWTVSIWLSLKSFIIELKTASSPKRNSLPDESRTHIQPFIKTCPRV